MLQGSSVLITGGAGFIGSNLAKLLRMHNSVFSIDNYSSGSTTNHHDGVSYFHGDVRNINQNPDLLELDIDYVFHFAEFSRIALSFSQPSHVIENNIYSTNEIIKFAKSKTAKLIYSGSSTKFDVDFQKNVSPYSLSKRFNSERLKFEFADHDYAIAYFYNVYGDNEIATGEFSTVIAKFLHLKKQGLPLPVNAPGTQSRNFTHVNDVVNALVLIALKGSGDDHCIAAKETYSILELANLIGDKIQMCSPAPGDRNSSKFDLNKVEELGWEPKHSLRKYLKGRII